MHVIADIDIRAVPDFVAYVSTLPLVKLEFLEEDLREALLDLKQAVVEDKDDYARQYIQEVLVLRGELILREGEYDA